MNTNRAVGVNAVAGVNGEFYTQDGPEGHMIKGGGSELKFPSNIWVYDDEGKYTPEILKAYER